MWCFKSNHHPVSLTHSLTHSLTEGRKEGRKEGVTCSLSLAHSALSTQCVLPYPTLPTLTHSLTHSLTHRTLCAPALSLPPTPTPTHSLRAVISTPTPTHCLPLTVSRSLTHSLTHSLTLTEDTLPPSQAQTTQSVGYGSLNDCNGYLWAL